MQKNSLILILIIAIFCNFILVVVPFKLRKAELLDAIRDEKSSLVKRSCLCPQGSYCCSASFCCYNEQLKRERHLENVYLYQIKDVHRCNLKLQTLFSNFIQEITKLVIEVLWAVNHFSPILPLSQNKNIQNVSNYYGVC
ncbi:hypothetical protein Glove_700g27 [Diversispora epigaea]|uniref:Uncharacterized protein n=1 Tax=Diversispora epigaea TaxID=1348612 RepID=A0A397GA76_9GLOM|nr:hypothetical protein Glove_700g27 [Diversispora epigaea]